MTTHVQKTETLIHTFVRWCKREQGVTGLSASSASGIPEGTLKSWKSRDLPTPLAYVTAHADACTDQAAAWTEFLKPRGLRAVKAVAPNASEQVQGLLEAALLHNADAGDVSKLVGHAMLDGVLTLRELQEIRDKLSEAADRLASTLTWINLEIERRS